MFPPCGSPSSLPLASGDPLVDPSIPRGVFGTGSSPSVLTSGRDVPLLGASSHEPLATPRATAPPPSASVFELADRRFPFRVDVSSFGPAPPPRADAALARALIAVSAAAAACSQSREAVCPFLTVVTVHSTFTRILPGWVTVHCRRPAMRSLSEVLWVRGPPRLAGLSGNRRVPACSPWLKRLFGPRLVLRLRGLPGDTLGGFLASSSTTWGSSGR